MTESRTTALDCLTKSIPLTGEMQEALRYNRHPQERTRLFHQVFGAPIRDHLTETPDREFSHMDDQRVAFRVSFILSELLELLEKGLGVSVRIQFGGEREPGWGPVVTSSDNASLCNAIQNALPNGHRDLVEVVDGLGDLNVVVNGFALELGVDMRHVDQEILASNLSKLGADGQPIVADGSDPRYPAGKILKGPNYVEPQLETLLRLSPPINQVA